MIYKIHFKLEEVDKLISEIRSLPAKERRVKLAEFAREVLAKTISLPDPYAKITSDIAREMEDKCNDCERRPDNAKYIGFFVKLPDGGSGSSWMWEQIPDNSGC